MALRSAVNPQGLSATAFELNGNDWSRYARHFETFKGSGEFLKNRIGSAVGSESAPQTVAAQGGVARLTTGANAGGTMALNGTMLFDALNWKASAGELTFEARILMSAITDIAVFAGFSDQIAALEMPFTLGGSDALTSNATDAVGVLFDTGADTDNWFAVGVANDVDATKQNLLVAPTAATYETWRFQMTAAGVATFYRNDALIGSAMAAAVTPGTLLTPYVAAFSRAAAARTVDVDYIGIQALRA